MSIPFPIRVGLLILVCMSFIGGYLLLTDPLRWKLSAWLVGPLVALGVGSVLYWHWTETQGAGDLRFYFVVQFFPLVALPILFLLFRPRYTGTGDMLASLACYGVAKLL